MYPSRCAIRFSFLLALISASSSLASNLSPASGPGGTVVEILSPPAASFRVLLADGSSEMELPTGGVNGQFFTLPTGSSAGTPTVKIVTAASTEEIVFTVTSPSRPRPAPRIDDITAAGVTFGNQGVLFSMMVHGANLEVGSQVIVDGEPQTTTFHRLLRNDANLHGGIAAELGYPIYHYATIWTQQFRDYGAVVTVHVRNLDGQVSPSATYEIGYPEEFDSDGDGLSDRWEINGVDVNNDGVIDSDLPSMGADPLRKDLYIEVDWMAGAAPNANIWPLAEQAFLNAPILNSDGSQGVVVHIDRGQNGGNGGTALPFTEFIGFGPDNPDPSFPYVDFYSLKADPTTFAPARLRAFRYCIFANNNAYQHGSSGQAEAIWCNDFFVSLANNGPTGQQQNLQLGTFLHELGHTLNLRHGGFEHVNRKPNYNSIMQYGRRGRSPGQFTGIDIDCDLNNANFVFTYGQGMRRILDERSLDEIRGCCGHIGFDWDGNGMIQGTVSVNLDDGGVLRELRDNADWASIELGFTSRSDWGNN